jgi:hypothetical protein
MLGDVRLRPVQTIEHLRLGVDRCLRRVLVLRRILRPGQDPAAERQCLTRLGEDREHHSRTERVLHLVALVAERETNRLEHVGRGAEPPRQSVPVVGRPTEFELASDVARKPSTPQVVPRRPRVGIGEEALVVPVDGSVHRFDELLAPRSLLGLAGRGVVQLDARLRGEMLDGARKVEMLDLLDEGEHVTALVAAEALVPPGLLADVERPALLGVERAESDPVPPHPFQSDVLLHRVDDRHRRPQSLDVVVDDSHDEANVVPLQRGSDPCCNDVTTSWR